MLIPLILESLQIYLIIEDLKTIKIELIRIFENFVK